MRQLALTALFISLVATGLAPAAEAAAKSKIVSVCVFKNGLALVRQEVQVPGPGSYRLDTAPNPVHGTFWIKSNCQVESALKLIDVEVPRAESGMQEELSGREVVVHLKDLKTKLTGKMEARKPAGLLALKTAAGSTFINPAEVAFIEAKGADKAKEATVKQQRPVLVLTVGKTDRKPAITLSYLTHGIGWAPSYLVEIADGKTLTIEMAVALRNELADLNEAEVKLMAGSPAVQLASVLSPLSPKQNIEKLLAGLKSDTGSPGDGTALKFTSLGKRTLKEGESLSLRVGREKVGYERVVEWAVASDESGSITEETWDVLHFKNPFPFPMATAPALVMDGDDFRAQRPCSRALPGEGASLRHARSQGMRTRGQEREDQPKTPAGKDPRPDIVRIGRYEYRRATIEGEMTVTNDRKRATTVIVRRTLRGKVLETDGDAKVQTLDEGVRPINPSNEVVWTVTLPPGGEKKVRYRYLTLIPKDNERWGLHW
jgi:hypothetical protein